jgi:DnaJ-class molecular chaperone
METLIALVLIWATGYVISLKIWPYGRCGRCEGTGRNTGSNARRWGTCKRCKGSGKKQRLGAQMVYRRRD